MRKNVACFMLLAFSLATSVSACRAETKCRVQPTFFCDEFEALAQKTPPDTLASLKATSKADVVTLHATFGMHVRNSFGLWSENELTAFFRRNEVADPEAMSYVITLGFIGYLNNEAVDMISLSKEALKPAPPQPQ